MVQTPYRVMVLFGTRAEALKLAPIIKRMQADPTTWRPVVVVTSQPRQAQLLQQAIDYLEISVDFDLTQPAEKVGQLVEELSQLLHNLNNVINASQPDMLLVVGDAATTLAASLVGFYHHLLIGHVEAGLRTWNKYSPYPEEMNRQMTDDLTDLYFAPGCGRIP